MTNARIEAAVQAKAKRIEAWNQSERPASGPFRFLPLTPSQVLGLSNHLVRNRLQVQDARHKALVAALRGLLRIKQEWALPQFDEDMTIIQIYAAEFKAAQAALKLAEEETL